MKTHADTAVHAKAAKFQGEKRTGHKTTLETQAVVQVFKNLDKHPEICRHCFGNHDLLECKGVKEGERVNCGAVFARDFREKTKVTSKQVPFLSRCSKKASE